MAALCLLGLALGWDSFRAALALGMLKPSALRQGQVALAFGLCDGLAPLLGLALGKAADATAAPWTKILGPFILGGYGLFQLVAPLEERPEESSHPGSCWVLFGMPVCLSLDNLIAGVGLEAVGVPIVVSVIVIGSISSLMALTGLRLGDRLGRALPIPAEWLSGAALVLLALVLMLDLT